MVGKIQFRTVLYGNPSSLHEKKKKSSRFLDKMTTSSLTMIFMGSMTLLSLIALGTLVMKLMSFILSVQHALLLLCMVMIYHFIDSRRQKYAKGFYSCSQIPSQSDIKEQNEVEEEKYDAQALKDIEDVMSTTEEEDDDEEESLAKTKIEEKENNRQKLGLKISKVDARKKILAKARSMSMYSIPRHEVVARRKHFEQTRSSLSAIKPFELEHVHKTSDNVSYWIGEYRKVPARKRGTSLTT
jgi:hypothetical protein